MIRNKTRQKNVMRSSIHAMVNAVNGSCVRDRTQTYLQDQKPTHKNTHKIRIAVPSIAAQVRLPVFHAPVSMLMRLGLTSGCGTGVCPCTMNLPWSSFESRNS